MIPLRSTERVRTSATVTAALIAANVLVFFYQLSLTQYGEELFIMRYGLVPDRLHFSALVTAIFLHGGWLHLIGNMLFLWVFGRNLEDLLGPGRYLLFYLICGIGAGLVQVLSNPYSPVPTIGASGAIAGIMGAYLLKFPRARIVTLVPIFVFLTTMEIPAAVLLIYWFAIQFLSGFGSLAYSRMTGGGTAWFAHIGGFLVGLFLINSFANRPPRIRQGEYWDA